MHDEKAGRDASHDDGCEGGVGDMLAHITGVDDVCMAEPSFSELLRCEYSLSLASVGTPHRALVHGGVVLGVVVEREGQYVLLTPMLARCSEAGRRLQEMVEHMAFSCEAVHTTRWKLICAVAQYYSFWLMSSLPHEPSSLFRYSAERERSIAEVVDGLGISGRVLEVGCGYGMSTRALERCGLEPFAIDNDASLVCEGLRLGGLHPERTAVLDARWLSCCFEQGEFGWVVGLMLGSIAPFTQPLWRTVLTESMKMAGRGVVFSVKEREEIEFVSEVCASGGFEGEVLDRTTGGMYDQWWYVGRAVIH
ncbi:MAG: methyltransferase domain-containing protein [Methermicoccaceae archaeon]